MSVSQLERWWIDWYLWWDNDAVATGIFFFTLHEIVYFGRCILWLLIEHIPALQKYRIQEKRPSAEEQWQCTKYVLATHFGFELPTIFLFQPLMGYVGMQLQAPFPKITTIAWQCVVFLLVEDTWHYIFHRILHTKTLYQYVHKTHHKYSTAFGLAAAYAHPVELVLLGLGTVAPPIVLSAISGGQIHIVTVYAWVVLRLLEAVDAHSGYNFPWSLHNWLPVWGGAYWHDQHHQYFIGNYSSSFCHWDILLGTTTEAMRKMRSKGRSEKSSMKRAEYVRPVVA